MTGSLGRPWVVLESPRPPRVKWDGSEHFTRVPGEEPSERCMWWVRQIGRGWLPPARWHGRPDDVADFYGVWPWEMRDILAPLIQGVHEAAVGACTHRYSRQHVFSDGRTPRFGLVCASCGSKKPDAQHEHVRVTELERQAEESERRRQLRHLAFFPLGI